MKTIVDNPCQVARKTRGSVEISHEQYEEYLFCLPPALHRRDRYAMGECWSGRIYFCFWHDRGNAKYYVALLDIVEFEKMTLEQLRELPNTC